MKKLLIILFALGLLSCEKENDITVTYRVSNAFSATVISHLNENGILLTDTINFESAGDVVSYSQNATKGDIVYLSAIYFDTLSSVTVEILLNGKIYKSKTSENDPGKYVIVSGSVPY